MRNRSKSQLKFHGISGWGGKRARAGRKNLSDTVNHMRRPALSLKNPLHITLRLREKLPSLRSKSLLKEFKESVRRAKEQGLSVIHFSIQSNHIHLFCESKNNRTLARGMRVLAGRFAKFVRGQAYARGAQKRGSVFNGRYHLHVLKSPREAKNALEYVLLNLPKHQKLIEYIDRFSSGAVFNHWKTLLGKRFRSLIKADAEFWEREKNQANLKTVLSPPQSWLAKTGWMKACV